MKIVLLLIFIISVSAQDTPNSNNYESQLRDKINDYHQELTKIISLTNKMLANETKSYSINFSNATDLVKQTLEKDSYIKKAQIYQTSIEDENELKKIKLYFENHLELIRVSTGTIIADNVARGKKMIKTIFYEAHIQISHLLKHLLAQSETEIKDCTSNQAECEIEKYYDSKFTELRKFLNDLPSTCQDHYKTVLSNIQHETRKNIYEEFFVGFVEKLLIEANLPNNSKKN